MQEEINILIVEDEEVWRESLIATLQNLGFTVSGVATSFEEGVMALNNQDFDVALIDINLHQQNSGIELGKMLHNLYKKPYLFITANDDGQTIAEAVKAGPSAYLTKPVDRTLLVANIHNAIHNFQAHISPAYATQPPPSDVFFVKNGKKYKQVQWSNVAYLYSIKNYTVIFNSADNTDHYIRSTLSKTLSLIIPQHLQGSFVQVNRKEAVQLSYIRELANEEIKTAYRAFAIGDLYAAELKDKMNVLS